MVFSSLAQSFLTRQTGYKYTFLCRLSSRMERAQEFGRASFFRFWAGQISKRGLHLNTESGAVFSIR
jgi:hypothetical protein